MLSWNSRTSSSDHSDWNVRKPTSQPKTENAIISSRISIVIICLRCLSVYIVRWIKFCSTNGTISTSAFYKLHYAKLMKAMIARKSSCLNHLFFTYGTFFIITIMMWYTFFILLLLILILIFLLLLLIKVHNWIIAIQISEESFKFSKLINLWTKRWKLSYQWVNQVNLWWNKAERNAWVKD